MSQSKVEQFEPPIIDQFLCEDGVRRYGYITNMPFIGNEFNEACTLKDMFGELWGVEMSEVVKHLGRDPRKF